MGILVTKPTTLFGDNLGLIQNSEIQDSDSKKKHIAISYHYLQEAIMVKIANFVWIKLYKRYTDICTKALGKIALHDLTYELMV